MFMENNMKTAKLLFVSFFLSLTFVLAAVSGVSAKRVAPPVISPIKVNGVEYRAPNTPDLEGVVQAWDLGKTNLLWSKKVYSTAKNAQLERDVQWVFIRSMTLGASGAEILVVNERGEKYVLNLVTKEVKKE
jgi:hypothetical protein